MAICTAALAGDWPGFRGPGGLAVSPDQNTSLAWDAAKGEGVLWKAEVPLPGAGSPIVWGERVFLSGAAGPDAGVMCFDAANGKLLWKSTVPLTGKPKLMDDNATLAAPTPVTDGERDVGRGEIFG